jgi:hypothetical protein
MKAPNPRPGRTWTWVSILGVVVLVGLVFLVRVPQPPPAPPPAAGKPAVGLVDPVVIRGTMLFDLTPLFLPTEFNSSRKDYLPREPGGAFAGFPFKHTFDDAELALRLPPAVDLPESPADALVGDPPGAPFLGFGRGDLKMEPVAPRGAYVEITEAGSGRDVLSEAVSDAHPPSSAPWKPMEFIAAVDAAGLVGPLIVTVHSDVGEVDAYFGRYLTDNLRIGQRLAPGFYRVCVGP